MQLLCEIFEFRDCMNALTIFAKYIIVHGSSSPFLYFTAFSESRREPLVVQILSVSHGQKSQFLIGLSHILFCLNRRSTKPPAINKSQTTDHRPPTTVAPTTYLNTARPATRLTTNPRASKPPATGCENTHHQPEQQPTRSGFLSHWSLATDHRPSTIGYRPPTTDHRRPSTLHRPPTTDYLPPLRFYRTECPHMTDVGLDL